ncbi:hypothetical protein MNBD_GAMMA17-615 [hydrothermal vent metagenome]|uniref:Uncharacterized protein n=1 Tax=hydrothermal vent metagenome TaxID=652676 RepID=A0A3B0ZDC3_9ZZZZ
MKNRSLLALLALAVISTPVLAQSKVVEIIEHYGIYVAAQKGYVKLGHYDYPGQFVDFKHLNELPAVERADENLKLVVFQKDFDEKHVILELRPIQTTVEVEQVRFNVKPLKEKDMYELTLDQSVPAGTILQAHSGYFWRTYMGAIVLGDTQKALEKYFSRKDLDDAYAVKIYLDDALKSYPDNPTLKKLSQHWDKEALKEKAAKDYGYVEKQWKKYKGTKKIRLQARYLKSLIGEINSYLRDHSDSEKAKEAEGRKHYAEKKLKELKEQL